MNLVKSGSCRRREPAACGTQEAKRSQCSSGSLGEELLTMSKFRPIRASNDQPTRGMRKSFLEAEDSNVRVSKSKTTLDMKTYRRRKLDVLHVSKLRGSEKSLWRCR